MDPGDDVDRAVRIKGRRCVPSAHAWEALVGQGLLLRLVFHPKTFPFDGHRFGVMEEAIQHGTGEGGIVVEDFGPVFKGQISRLLKNSKVF